MDEFEILRQKLINNPKLWLITGVAGFIGSNLLEHLLKLKQFVIGLDNFSTGYKRNLDEVKKITTETEWNNFRFIEGDICDFNICHEATKEVDYVLHQAALGSVPRSIKDPLNTNKNNITGFLNMLVASRDAKVKRFVYAASSSTYGDHPDLPKVEEKIGNPLSPYAVTKYVNELYSSVFSRIYEIETIGLRYFNVFGKRQDPSGSYAAVIPKWTASMINKDRIYINGDGVTSRDFCFIENTVQANLLAATINNPHSINQVYNVAVGQRTNLNKLFFILQKTLADNGVDYTCDPIFKDFRKGDVRHSQADISKAREYLNYNPFFDIESGIAKAMPWYINFFKGA